MLLDSEKVKNKVDGIESLKKDSVKKSKVSVVSKTSVGCVCQFQNLTLLLCWFNFSAFSVSSPFAWNFMLLKKQGIRRQWTPREVVSGPITKDEEEVAETLYALAGMFPDNGSNHNNKELEGESLPDNSSVLQNLEDNASAALALEGCLSFSPLSGILVKIFTQSFSLSYYSFRRRFYSSLSNYSGCKRLWS